MTHANGAPPHWGRAVPAQQMTQASSLTSLVSSCSPTVAASSAEESSLGCACSAVASSSPLVSSTSFSAGLVSTDCDSAAVAGVPEADPAAEEAAGAALAAAFLAGA